MKGNSKVLHQTTLCQKKKKGSLWRDLFKDFSPKQDGETNTGSEALLPSDQRVPPYDMNPLFGC